MVLIQQNKISSGINGFACEEPWDRLKPERTSSDFQPQTKLNR